MFNYVNFHNLILASRAVFICVDAYFKLQLHRCVTVFDIHWKSCYHEKDDTIVQVLFRFTTTPQLFYGPFSGTTWVSCCQKRTSVLYGARVTEADTPIIRLGATPSGLTSAQLHLPPYFFGLNWFKPYVWQKQVFAKRNPTLEHANPVCTACKH